MKSKHFRKYIHNTKTSFIFQRISMAIQRGNPSCVLGRVLCSDGLDEIFKFETTDRDHISLFNSFKCGVCKATVI